MDNSTRYMRRGVSSKKEDVHQAIRHIDKGLFPHAFCKVIPDMLGQDPEYCNVMHADGAGTNTSLAYMYWKETGDDAIWKGIAQDALIMNVDDLLCVGATDNIVLSSTIGRNKNLIPGEVISAIINGTEELLTELAKFGVNIRSTGGETADVGDLVRTIIVDSTVTWKFSSSEYFSKPELKLTALYAGYCPELHERLAALVDEVGHQLCGIHLAAGHLGEVNAVLRQRRFDRIKRRERAVGDCDNGSAHFSDFPSMSRNHASGETC